jgi:beta-glucanase (GH16 family)
VLDWSDTFDYTGPPDPRYWSYESGYLRNNEHQYYTEDPENVRVENSRLKITALRTNKYPRGYSSASIHTRGKREFHYGRWVLRAKIEPRQGSWPAWWSLGVKNAWPRYGEIDMMEYYGNTLLANFAWEANGIQWDTARVPVSSLGPGWGDGFHVWEMIWNRDSIHLSMDGMLLNQIDIDDAGDGDYNPFRDHNHYMLINQAIGGTNGGDPANQAFPIVYEVDYVKYYVWDPNATQVSHVKAPGPKLTFSRRSDCVILRFKGSQSEPVTVFDWNGKQIARLKGGKEILWDASGLERGIYFILPESGGPQKYLLM